MEKEEGAHWTLMSATDFCKIPVICQIVHLMRKGSIKNKKIIQFAFDLKQAAYNEYEYCTESGLDPKNEGSFIPEFFKNVKNYITP